MTLSCGLDIGCQINLWFAGVKDHLLGWVPDWLWALAPYWWIPVGLLVIGIVWKFSGWPGLLALAGTVGAALGWKLRGDYDEAHKPPPPKPVPAAKPKRKTLADLFK